MRLKIVPLSGKTLLESISLLKEIFSDDTDQRIIQLSLKESLYDNDPDKTFWVAIGENKKVIGTTGLYTDRKDTDNTSIVWLGWFGVHPDYRKRGIGSELLEFTINEAKQRGYGFLKLYTSTDENERDAHKLYKKFGFSQLSNNHEPNKIFFVKDIKNSRTNNKGAEIVREIKIEWKGPYKTEEVIRDMTAEEDYGLYQIYGDHILCGPSKLLYIGKNTERTFSTRIGEHKEWLDEENNIQIYLGRVYDKGRHKESNDWDSWKEDIGLAEKILIYKYSPHYNSREIANPPKLPKETRIKLIHEGNRSLLHKSDIAPNDYS